MKHDTMIGTRLPKDLVRELERIERTEHADRSTTVRKLLANAVRQWKLEYASKEYATGRASLARSAHDAGVSIWEMTSYHASNGCRCSMIRKSSATTFVC